MSGGGGMGSESEDKCPGNIHRDEGSLTKGKMWSTEISGHACSGGSVKIYIRNGSKHCDSREWYQEKDEQCASDMRISRNEGHEQTVYRKQGARPTISIKGPLGYENSQTNERKPGLKPWPIQTRVERNAQQDRTRTKGRIEKKKREKREKREKRV
ncbi:hypothetical protein BO71DRAFT_170387 [Aspergillus ellipticus CBS 707.79]|uniref:Uncharacterized protein n=1 Tax=Aspergillus ellipticus CBS 707.79 TaxID=1448320 RepID=A0A319DPW9_9EURO|nr:hypothetical protein BO71DRAFT_170387 [Aspergillus ellipticus CBS 707.79]